MKPDSIIWFDKLGIQDIPEVGGKNASLGEMLRHLHDSGVAVPLGFATTASAYREFLEFNKLTELIEQTLSGLDVENISALSASGAQLRSAILAAQFPTELEEAIRIAYATLCQKAASNAVAVRSSATAEDLPQASFAGQQETFLNISGIKNVLNAVKSVFASLFNDRAIAYRVHHGFDHMQVALSAGIQHMVRSDIGASGVMFTLDTESGFSNVIFVTSSYGLGETIVQGAVNPDEFYLFKPNVQQHKPAIIRRSLGDKAIRMVLGADKPTIIENVPSQLRTVFSIRDEDVEKLAHYALLIEQHYQRPMDIEWAKDGVTGELYILQARPETVKSRASAQAIERYRLQERSQILVSGRSVGQRIGAGVCHIVNTIDDMQHFEHGSVLVADMTDPDWEPIMKRAAAIVTNRGGRTCHAAIIARELGIPAVVGCNDATQKLINGQELTVSCAEGDTGYVYSGKLNYEKQTISLDSMPQVPVKIMLNVGNPDRAFEFASIPNSGVGLARIEFIINRMIGIHPKALLESSTLSKSLQESITERSAGYATPVAFYVDKLTEGIATLAAAFFPKPVIVRLSDFKSNEYASLLGGEHFEPQEENPMLGFRGAARYVSPSFQACFELECQAINKVRDVLGLTNVEIMIPFVRTVAELKAVIELLRENGLERGKNGLRIIMMCEIPSNALLADEFLNDVDGYSIGSNDLTQLTLGIDRDSALVASSFDERNAAVKALLHLAIEACLKRGKYIGICGQGPSDHPDLAAWLLDEKIESMSLNPDTVVETWLYLAGESTG